MSTAGALVVEACAIIERCGYAVRFGDGGAARWGTRGVSWSDPIRRVVWLRPSARDATHEQVAPLYAHEAIHVVQQSGGVRRGGWLRRAWWGARYATSAAFRWRVEVDAEAVEAWARWVVAGRPPTSEGGIRALVSAPALSGNRAPYRTGRAEGETVTAIVAAARRYIVDGARPWPMP